MGINDGTPTKNRATRRYHALDEWSDQQFPCRTDQAAFLFRSPREDADRYWTAIPSNLVVTGAHRPYPNDHGKEYEIDVHEGFGDNTRLHSAIHWNTSPVTHDFPSRGVVDMPAGVDLSAGFNTWGCKVTKEQQIFFFNGVEVGRVETPSTADSHQPYGIILDVSAGLPWDGGGPPSGGPHDMIVRYVRLYAPDMRGLTLK